MSLLSSEQQRQLSKFMSLVLRHEPQKIGLTLGDEGFVPLDTFVAAVNRQRNWHWIREEHIREVVQGLGQAAV